MKPFAVSCLFALVVLLPTGATAFLEAENEIMEKKIVEVDARPSDCIALAVRQSAPIFVVKEVWDDLKDMTSVLEELRDKGMELEGGE